MEREVYCRLWYYKNLEEGKKYYFDSKKNAEIARFNEYCRYDAKRISIRGYVVPVSRVAELLVKESELSGYNIISDIGLDTDDYSM